MSAAEPTRGASMKRVLLILSLVLSSTGVFAKSFDCNFAHREATEFGLREVRQELKAKVDEDALVKLNSPIGKVLRVWIHKNDYGSGPSTYTVSVGIYYSSGAEEDIR